MKFRMTILKTLIDHKFRYLLPTVFLFKTKSKHNKKDNDERDEMTKKRREISSYQLKSGDRKLDNIKEIKHTNMNFQMR